MCGPLRFVWARVAHGDRRLVLRSTGHAARPRTGRRMAAGLARVVWERASHRSLECTRDAACAADQSAVPVQFRCREQPNETRATDAGRTNAAHEIGGATGSVAATLDASSRHRRTHSLTERSSAATRILRQIPEDARRLLGIPPSFILPSQRLLPTFSSHLPNPASRCDPPPPSTFRPATAHPASVHHAVRSEVTISVPWSCKRRVDLGAAEVPRKRPSVCRRACRGRAVPLPPEVRRRRDTPRR